VGTVSILSGDRLALGCGAGWLKEEFDVLGVDFRTRGKRFDEMLEVMRKLWHGGMVEHHGDFFDFDRLQMSPAPGRAIPIYIGGISPVALRRAARLGEGWIGTGHSPAEVPDLLDKLGRLRREAGRGSEPFESIVPLTTPLDVELLRRLEEETGMTATVSYPFNYTLGPSSSLEQKRELMMRFGDEIIARTG
jgi:alkanesulfonate monooxygenase SsuD/methylene tetrahydromethanopterin reductase-like flavin-dependent oxidoreductase (luciferase family)